MPFDGNGNFSLPPGYLAISGQTVLPSQHNPPLEDIAAGLSQTFLRSGVTPMLGNINANGFSIDNLPDGSGSQPVTFTQLMGIIATSGLVPTGAKLDGFWTVAPTGYVLANGGTIGSATSGATTRANADTLALYTLFWTSFSNTVLPIQNSSGVATTRGATAADDFAANKRLPVFDTRSRFARTADGGLGFDTGLTVGATQADIIKNHTHTGTTNTAGNHNHGIDTDNDVGGGTVRVGRVDAEGSTTLIDTRDAGSHSHTVTTNVTVDGSALETRPRSIVVLSCIKL